MVTIHNCGVIVVVNKMWSQEQDDAAEIALGGGQNGNHDALIFATNNMRREQKVPAKNPALDLDFSLALDI